MTPRAATPLERPTNDDLIADEFAKQVIEGEIKSWGGRYGEIANLARAYLAMRRAPSSPLVGELIPDGWALDHLCQHYIVGNGVARLTGGWTCKLGTDGGGKILKVQAEGDTVVEAIAAASALSRAKERT